MNYEGLVAGKLIQEPEPGKSNLKFSGPRATKANSMRRKWRKSFAALLLIAAAFITLASAQDGRRNTPKPESLPRS